MNETLLDRVAEALGEAIYIASPSDCWEVETSRTLLAHVASELLVLEEYAGRSLSLQEAVAFLCRGAEGRA
jgi:hypothetical protein